MESGPDPSNIPLALYVHTPWCESKCPYCDFNSHALKGSLPEQKYTRALLQDLELDLADYAHAIGSRRIESIFIGGGTPSLLSSEAIGYLLESIKQRIECRADLEISLEANPGSGDLQKFQGYRSAGVNRLSVGVQSFNADHLRNLGRIHSNVQAHHAISAAERAGFDNYNIDLMFGLPQQNLAQAITDITHVVEHFPSHVSCYQLTIEPNTWFHRHPPTLPDEDLLWTMQETVVQELTDAGYTQYEVSAFARDGHVCKHNLNYWRFGDYLGIGAGAHGKITGPGGIERTWKTKHPRQYLLDAGTRKRVGGRQQIEGPQLVLEFMLNALRLREFIDGRLFTARTGFPLACIEPKLNAARDEGLLEWDQRGFRASKRGYRYLNFLLDRFILDGLDKTPGPVRMNHA